MTSKEMLKRLSELLEERNRIDNEIAKLINRPAERSHIGEFVARAVFAISEPSSATRPGSDGEFLNEPLRDKTVNVKYYGKDDGVWDVKPYPATDYYLVLTGDRRPAASSRGQTRPLTIKHVYVVSESFLQQEGVKPGVAASVKNNRRFPFEVYPTAGNGAVMQIDQDQRELLDLFNK